MKEIPKSTKKLLEASEFSQNGSPNFRSIHSHNQNDGINYSFALVETIFDGTEIPALGKPPLENRCQIS